MLRRKILEKSIKVLTSLVEYLELQDAKYYHSKGKPFKKGERVMTTYGIPVKDYEIITFSHLLRDDFNGGHRVIDDKGERYWGARRLTKAERKADRSK